MADTPTSVPKKHELLQDLLDKGMVMVHLDARAQGVDVPEQFRDQAALALNLSYQFQGGLEVDEDGVRAGLSFSGRRYHCEVPLGTIYAMVSHVTGEGFFFPSDAPAEALAGLAAMASPREEWADDDDDARPALRPVTGVESPDTGPWPRPVPADEDAPPRRPVLRAIDGGLNAPEPDDDPAPVEEASADEAGAAEGPRAAEDVAATEDAAAAEDAATDAVEATDETTPSRSEQGGGDGRPPWLRVIK